MNDETPANETATPDTTIIEVLPRDKIVAIDDPQFVPAAMADLPEDEPVIGLAVGEDTRAYALSLLDGHEIVNDVVDGMPVAVTW